MDASTVEENPTGNLSRGATRPTRIRGNRLAGHYGSGKTNLAVNWAMHLRETGKPVLVADLDIVNPFFRSAEQGERLKRAGVDMSTPQPVEAALQEFADMAAELEKLLG